MNKAYRLVFNKTLGLFQVASELAKTNGCKASKSYVIAPLETLEPKSALPFNPNFLASCLASALLCITSSSYVFAQANGGYANGSGTYANGNGGTSATGGGSGGAGGYYGGGGGAGAGSLSSGSGGSGGNFYATNPSVGGNGGSTGSPGGGGGAGNNSGAGSGAGGGAGGGGGGAGAIGTSNSVSVTGGVGGVGGVAYRDYGAGGSGGGGVGFVITSGSNFTNTGSITGGAGGAGAVGFTGSAGTSGFSINGNGGGAGGNPGNGGAGIFLGTNSNVITNGVNASLIGGAGGAGGTGGTGGAGGNVSIGTVPAGAGGGGSDGNTGGTGASGVIIGGANDSLINSGNIIGGAGGAGGTGGIGGVGGNNTSGIGTGSIGGGGGGGGNGGTGGAGGAGVVVTGTNAVIVNGGNITGGGAGLGGTGGVGGAGGTGGDGGGPNGGMGSSGLGGTGAPGILVSSGSTISSIINTGTIAGGSGKAGIQNSGVITTLNNLQGVGNISGPLTYSGVLPLNYNIIIADSLSYGQLSVSSVTGPMTFGIATGSAVTYGTYSDVLQGFISLGGVSGTSGTYNGYTYSLLADTGHAGYWNLQLATTPVTMSAGTTTQTSVLGQGSLPSFNGGTLQVVSGSQNIANNFTVDSNNGVIDQHGLASSFSGVISNAVSGTPGSITIANTGSGGSVTFSGTNTYTGSTTINSAAKLALSGTGSIATSSGVINNGAFDISGTSAGASIKAISGSGATTLGTQNLAITNASGNLSGAVTGSGGINITGGNQTLSGNNSGFTGGVQVQSGAALTIPAASALGTGSLALVGSSSVPATLNVTGNTTIANNITVAGDPVFNIVTGTTTTVSSPITNGGATGDVVVAGGGTLDLSAANTYTGTTTIGSASTLALTGAGSIATSSSVMNNGTFNVSVKTGNVSVASYNQGPTGSLVMGFASTNNQRVNVAGTASLAGSLNLVASGGTYLAGRYTILTANGVSGTFGSFSSNLGSYTNLPYSLSYDANDVYLNLFGNTPSGPSTANTQVSLQNTAQALQNIYTLQNSVLANSFSYDCNEFGANGICISAGGRNTAASAANGLNNTSALLIAAYKVHPQVRIGAYADQNLSMNNGGSTVNLGNNTPLIGLFGAWNEHPDGTGTEVKVVAAYGQKNNTVTRSVVGSGATASEAGNGSSQLNSQGAQITAKYGFTVSPQVIVSPYVSIRYTQNNMGGYTEGTSTSVTAPLTYSALNTNATTALAGVGASYKIIPTVTTFASAGVETDTSTSNGTYSATGVSGLTPINFNANPVKTRPTATLGAYYDIEKNQRVGITGIYRQEAYQAVQTTTLMATYTIGM